MGLDIELWTVSFGSSYDSLSIVSMPVSPTACFSVNRFVVGLSACRENRVYRGTLSVRDYVDARRPCKCSGAHGQTLSTADRPGCRHDASTDLRNI